MIQHHPDDELLLALAAGRLDLPEAMVLGAHLESCPRCRQAHAAFEAAGGALLEEAEPLELEVGAYSRTLERIGISGAPATHGAHGAHAAAVARSHRPPLPAGAQWPRSLDACTITPWRRLGPGMRWSRVVPAGAPSANMFLLRMAAGMELAAHTHSGRELTQVLYGAFDDGRALWGAGDLDATDEHIHHRPVVSAESECICLVAVSGRVRFDGLVARTLGAWMGI